MSHHDRSPRALSPGRLFVTDVVHVAAAGERYVKEGVTWQISRIAPRRCEIRAARRAAIVRHARWLTTLLSVGVLASLWLTLPGPQCFTPSRVAQTKLKLEMFAFAAYPAWSLDHPERACPGSLRELTEYMNNRDDRDAWGNRFEFWCGHDFPAGAQGIWVRSAGEDGRFDTDDDLDLDRGREERVPRIATEAHPLRRTW